MKAILLLALVAVASAQLTPGDHTLTIEGRPEGTRQFIVHVPNAYTRLPSSALVFSWHGYTDNCARWSRASGFSQISDAGFVAVYPCGTGAQPSFNAGVCCGNNKNDDVELARLIIARLKTELPKLNTSRVFTSGMSNGGMMSEQLGCKSSSLFRAIASIGGTLVINPGWTQAFDECDKLYTKPAAVLLVHGTADPTVPWNGNQAYRFPPIPENFKRWAQRSKCTGTPVQTFKKGVFSNSIYQSCAAGPVELITHEGGQHVWPNTTDFSSPAYAWQFFNKF